MALNDIKVPKENAQGTFDEVVLTPSEIAAVPTSRSISAGTGLTGGGDLTDNRTLSVSFGSSAGTACEGNDARLSDSRTPTAHTHELTALAATGATNGHVLTANGSGGVTFAAASGGGVTGAASSASDVLGVSGSNITGVDANADRIVYWNNTSNKLEYGTPANVGAAAASHTHAAADVTSGVFANSLINFAAPDAIGSTTRNTGAFTTLSANNGTLTASAPVLDLAQTWNNAAVTFTGFRFNVTNTNSSALSLFADFQVGGTTQFSVRRDGLIFARNRIEIQNTTVGFQTSAAANGASPVRYASDTNGLGQIYTSGNVVELLGTTTTSPQTFRLYNTFTDASNYERAELRWTSNVCELAVTRAGTGSSRSFRIIVGGLTAQTIASGSGTTELVPIVAFGNGISFSSRGQIFPSADGVFRIQNNAGTDFGRLQFGGTTSSFPALKRSSTAIQVRLADDSAFAPFECAGLTLNGNLTASTRDIVTDTTTGTRIGTGTTQLLGFWNAAPSAQPAAVADATDAASTQARLNDLLARLRTIGIIAT